MNSWDVFADAAENLHPARMQMALSVGWHIIFACFGIAFPLLTVFVEWRGHRRGDAELLRPQAPVKAGGQRLTGVGTVKARERHRRRAELRTRAYEPVSAWSG